MNNKGTILVSSLWILAILSILAIGIGFRVSIEARLSKYNLDRTKALYMARAGYFKAIEILSKDSNEYDSMEECGVFLKGTEEKTIQLAAIFTKVGIGEGTYSIGYRQEDKDYPGMMDEERKININTAKREVLATLLGEDNKDIAPCIIDWRDADDMVSSNGAESSYYESTFGYKCRNAPFSSIEELMLVKDMTPKIFDSIKDYITVFGPADGKVNLNTATEKVIRIIGKSTLPPISDVVMNEIVAKRWGKKDEKALGPESETVFRDEESIKTLLNLGGYEEDFNKIKNSFTTKSDYFRIESKGIVAKSNIEKVVAYTVQRDAKEGAVLKSYREY
jgi:type II secretory pathway component PulK